MKYHETFRTESHSFVTVYRDEEEDHIILSENYSRGSMYHHYSLEDARRLAGMLMEATK